MSMFDDIKYQGRDFQTKDFDCEMDKYLIEGGRLLLRVWHLEPTCPSGERKAIEDPPLDMSFHGRIRFYTNNWKMPENVAGEWEEYLAKFTDGALVSVVRVRDEAIALWKEQVQP